MGRSSRWLVILPAVFFAFFPQEAKADPQPGLNAVGYTIDEIPPLRSDDAYPVCGSELENNINRSFDGEPFTGCGWDWFMVHYTGFITIPENTSIEFMVAADDGGTVNIGGYNIGTWNLKGCSWSQVVSPELPGGTYGLDGWFFEAGGSTCYMLAWRINEGDWEIVPEWAFTTTFTPPTTTSTTTAPSTTAPATTTTSTTLQETTTSSDPTTTVPQTAPPTTAEETTTSSSTTTTTEPQTTSTTSTTTTTTEPETTTTSSTENTSPPATSPTPEAVAPPPATTIEPATTVPEESTPEEQQPPVTDPPVPDTSLVEPPAPEPTVPDPQEPAVEDAPILPPDASESSESDETPEPASDTPETLLEALDASPEPTPEQATQLATNPEVLAAASVEQAEAIFEALNVEDLNEEQVEALIAAVQDAPAEIRATFEDTINIFGEGLDDYVPLGSTIPVGTRRTLIAVTAGITLAATGSRIRR